MDDLLNALREQIDAIDEDILNMLNQRMMISKRIGDRKSKLGIEVIDFNREDEIIKTLLDRNQGPLPNTTLAAVFREIFSGSRSLQHPEKIAFLGPLGTFSHEAAIKKFGEAAELIPCNTISDIFHELDQGATYAVVPIENSIEGSVRETLDLLMFSSNKIIGEISLRIAHSIMNSSGQIGDVKQVGSHPQALAQCRQWLNSNLPGISLAEISSTAKAAELAVKNPDFAAIGNQRYGTSLGLKIISKGIQDRAENYTRFLILGKAVSKPSGHDLTSLVFWTEDKPGALFSILEKFARYGINLSRIESRPDKGANLWKYAFFVDLVGHRQDSKIAECLVEVEKVATNVKVLGSYPVSPVSDD